MNHYLGISPKSVSESFLKDIVGLSKLSSEVSDDEAQILLISTLMDITNYLNCCKLSIFSLIHASDNFQYIYYFVLPILNPSSGFGIALHFTKLFYNHIGSFTYLEK